MTDTLAQIAALGVLTALSCAAVWFTVVIGYFTINFLNSILRHLTA